MVQSIPTLNALRRRAVELRLEGRSLADTHAVVGLSAPTIIAAVKAYRRGGWPAVDVGPRGRPRGTRIRATRTVPEPTDTDRLQHELVRLMQPGRRGSADKISTGADGLWSLERLEQQLRRVSPDLVVDRDHVLRRLERLDWLPTSRRRQTLKQLEQTVRAEYDRFATRARRRGVRVLWLGTRRIAVPPASEPSRPPASPSVGKGAADIHQLFAHALRGSAFWLTLDGPPEALDYQRFIAALQREFPNGIALVLPGAHLLRPDVLGDWLTRQAIEHRVLQVAEPDGASRPTTTRVAPLAIDPHTTDTNPSMTRTQAIPSVNADTSPIPGPASMTHLDRLEAESIHILREVVAEADNPVMLYSIGKDSAVMLHLARKAFYPAVPPFPLLHVDTTWKFRAMYEFRERMAEETGMELIRHVNPDGLAQGVNPFTHGSALHTDIMKTEGLKQALDQHRFDIAFGGARRDEEKSRAKERIFSFRTAQHRWDPKAQRPELWQLYNTRKRAGESIRVFPISNWTELDIWQYIHRESIPIVPLYFAAERPIVHRDGSLIMVDDERMPLHDGEVPEMRRVRFRTLGCYPLTGAVESTAETLTDVIQEMLLTKSSERQGRMIDHDSAASMEKKKQEGYF